MIKIKQAIIVEGKYDKIRLSNLVDALIIPTNGFAIYKDKETAELIKTLAKKTGIIILTDSDSAGLQIRNALRNIVCEGEVINVYIPDIHGKERRKRTPSKQGLLGVEGIDDEILLKAFEKAGVFAEKSSVTKEPITKADLVEWGLSGGANSAAYRAELQKKLGLPERLSANLFLEILNVMYSREEFLKLLSENKT
ncbi:MAG: toprim domain-containing protein [Oscillospiraceae bacterium]